MNTITILYPEQRQVTEEQVKSWAADSFFNHADRYQCCTCGHDTMTEGDCKHEGQWTPIYNEPTEAPRDLAAAIEWLDDHGEVTFARRNT